MRKTNDTKTNTYPHRTEQSTSEGSSKWTDEQLVKQVHRMVTTTTTKKPKFITTQISTNEKTKQNMVCP